MCKKLKFKESIIIDGNIRYVGAYQCTNCILIRICKYRTYKTRKEKCKYQESYEKYFNEIIGYYKKAD